jgi:hypothetical protein
MLSAQIEAALISIKSFGTPNYGDTELVVSMRSRQVETRLRAIEGDVALIAAAVVKLAETAGKTSDGAPLA